MFKKIAGTPLYLLVLVNLVLKLAMFCYIAPWDKTSEANKILTSDSKGYQDVALRLIHNHSFAPSKDTLDINTFSDSKAWGFIMLHPDGWMMPAYPVFLAAVYTVAGIKPFVTILIQILLSLISVVLVYRICMLLFENIKIATIAALLFALDIHSIYMANLMLTDTLFVLVFLASIYYFAKGMKTERLMFFWIAAIYMAFACLTRLLVLVYPVALAIIVVAFSGQKIAWKLKAVLSYVLLLSFVVGLWSYRNYRQYDRFQVTTHGGWTLLFFYASFAKERETHQNIDSIRVVFQQQADSAGMRKSKNIFDQSDIYGKIASNYISKHKGTYLMTNLQGCVNMFLSLGNMGMAKTLGWDKTGPKESFAEVSAQRISRNFSADIRETILGIAILLLMMIQYIGAVYGMIKLFISRNYMAFALILLTTLYFAGISGVIGNYRFKLPLVPFICIAAGYGCFYIVNRKGNKTT